VRLIGYPKSWIAKPDDLYAGREIIFIGYPDGIGTPFGFKGSVQYSDKKSNPLIRKGIIAWLADSSDVGLIDGVSFGGNSGSPVFSPPTIQTKPELIGMITGHLTDVFLVNELNIDTANKRINSFQDKIDVNNGLAIFLPATTIYDIVNAAIAKRKEFLSRNKAPK